MYSTCHFGHSFILIVGGIASFWTSFFSYLFPFCYFNVILDIHLLAFNSYLSFRTILFTLSISYWLVLRRSGHQIIFFFFCNFPFFSSSHFLCFASTELLASMSFCTRKLVASSRHLDSSLSATVSRLYLHPRSSVLL